MRQPRKSRDLPEEQGADALDKCIRDHFEEARGGGISLNVIEIYEKWKIAFFAFSNEYNATNTSKVLC